MTSSVILAHPYERSFNHAMYHTAVRTLKDNKVKVYAHDLYEENFNPVLTKKELGSDASDDPLVNKYAMELIDSDILVYIHPNWWGQPPAILKGYIDRVIRPPHAYDFPDDDSSGGLPIEKLKGKTGIVYNTSNTEAERENKYFRDPLDRIWGKCVFGFTGITGYHRKMFRIIAGSTDSQRNEWLEEIKTDIITILSKR